MPTDTKQLTADEVLERLNVIEMHGFSEKHTDEWRNQVARDLNQIVEHSTWCIETDGDTPDAKFGNAVLRIVARVSESEKIVAKGKPE